MSDFLFTRRAQRGAACDYIDINNDAEAAHYTGAGLRLAQVKAGQIVAMFDPATLPYQDDADLAAADAWQAALAWANAHAEGTIWLGECSCYQFCTPKQISTTNAAHVAHLAAAIDKYLREMQS